MVEGYPDSLASWGAPAIFKEAGRLLGKYFRLLHPFIAAFFLPVVVIDLLQLWGEAWGNSHHVQGGGPGLHENLYARAPPSHPHPHPLVPLLLFRVAPTILRWLFTSLAIASISRAVAHIYSQDPPDSQDSSITKSIFKSLPSSLYRIFITILVVLLFIANNIFLFFIFLLFLFFFFHFDVFFTMEPVFDYIALIILYFVFLLAFEVAVLEPNNYGWAALRRSWKLVHSKLRASLIFFLVLFVLELFPNLTQAVVLLPATGKLPFWTLYVLGVVWAVIYLAVTVFSVVAAVVLYFATKLKVESEGEYLPANTREEYAPPVPIRELRAQWMSASNRWL